MIQLVEQAVSQLSSLTLAWPFPPANDIQLPTWIMWLISSEGSGSLALLGPGMPFPSPLTSAYLPGRGSPFNSPKKM